MVAGTVQLDYIIYTSTLLYTDEPDEGGGEEHGVCESYWMEGNLTYLDNDPVCKCAQKLSQESSSR